MRHRRNRVEAILEERKTRGEAKVLGWEGSFIYTVSFYLKKEKRGSELAPPQPTPPVSGGDWEENWKQQ